MTNSLQSACTCTQRIRNQGQRSCQTPTSFVCAGATKISQHTCIVTPLLSWKCVTLFSCEIRFWKLHFCVVWVNTARSKRFGTVKLPKFDAKVFTHFWEIAVLCWDSLLITAPCRQCITVTSLIYFSALLPFFLQLFHAISHHVSSITEPLYTTIFCSANCKSNSHEIWFCAGSGFERMDPLRFLVGCRKGRLNQALSVLSLSLGFFWVCLLCC